MSDKKLYLKDEVYFEPLFNHWYAWPHLLSPVTAARHTLHTHRRIMSSFVNNYKLHILAQKESTMVGSEFMDCTEDQVNDIKSMIADIDDQCADLVELSNGIDELEDLLRKHESGESIEYIYELVPNCLKGYIEIFLDTEHKAGYRLIEPLIYKSKYYDQTLQSVSFGMLSKVKERPFVLSTPRLADENHMQVAMDFNADELDKILMSRQIPISEKELDDIFEGRQTAGGLHYKDLFTDQPSEYRHEPVTEDVKVQYTGHAGFLIETKDMAILVDPVIANRGPQNHDQVISYSQLPPKIDYICITHNHSDHINLETLLQLRYKTRNIVVPKNNGGSIVDPSMRLLLKQLNFNVIEVDDLDTIAFNGGTITSLPFIGEHGDLNIRSKTAWLVEVMGKKIFFGADSSNPENMMYQYLQELIGDLDILCIGMECVGAPYTWLYGALHTQRVSKAIKNSRRLNGSDFEQANQLIDTFKPKQVYIYALGMEPWYKYFMGVEYDDDSTQIVESNKLLSECAIKGRSIDRLYGKKTIEFS